MIKYEFFDYDKMNERLNNLIKTKYKNEVRKLKPIAYSPCGFEVEHYVIGKGDKHFIVMGGTHGNEIIGPDFVTQLMENIASGEGYFKDFDENSITIDFIPCQNPEGFIISTEILKKYLEGKSEDVLQTLSRSYWQAYREDDRRELLLNKFLTDLGAENNIKENFWDKFRFKEISKKELFEFCQENFNINKETFEKLWKEKIIPSSGIIKNGKIINNGNRYEVFPDISYEDIEEKDERYIKLKEKVKNIMQKDYTGYTFPKESLIDWRSNARGIDLNKNNPINLNLKLEERNLKNKKLFGSLRFSNLLREVPGPQGSPSINMDVFEFEPENYGLLKYLINQIENGEYIGMISYHGTGGLIYYHPLKPQTIRHEMDKEIVSQIDEINTFIADIYEKETGYIKQDYPKKITGTGDMLRNLIPGFLLIELSKMGGNPLGPYGDKDGNYTQTISTNFKAFSETIKYAKEVLEKENKKKELKKVIK